MGLFSPCLFEHSIKHDALHTDLIRALYTSDKYLFFTGVKLIVVADNKQQKVEELLKKLYELYADYVLKNPFYSLDMPIR